MDGINYIIKKVGKKMIINFEMILYAMHFSVINRHEIHTGRNRNK